MPTEPSSAAGSWHRSTWREACLPSSAQGPVVTVAVNSFLFKEAVFVGDLVSFYAHVVKVGRTSITVDVEVYAQRGSEGRGDIVKVTEATLTYVAVDQDRKPRPLPSQG
jgi:acyl-CoA thioesterase YciA